jgi:hypothetical protein
MPRFREPAVLGGSHCEREVCRISGSDEGWPRIGDTAANGELRFRSVAEQEDLRYRDRVGMGDGQQRRSHVHPVRPRGRTSVQPELRRTKRAEHFDVLPEHAARMTRSERLHRGFFRGESPGEMRHGVAALRTIGDLPVREHAAQESLSVSLECAGDARNVGGIDAQSEDRHGSAPA